MQTLSAASLQRSEKIKESYNWVVDLNQNIVFYLFLKLEFKII